MSGRDDAVVVEPPPYCLPNVTVSSSLPLVPLTPFFPSDMESRFQVRATLIGFWALSIVTSCARHLLVCFRCRTTFDYFAIATGIHL